MATLDASPQLGSNPIMAPFCCGRRVPERRSHVAPSTEPDLEDVGPLESCLFKTEEAGG